MVAIVVVVDRVCRGGTTKWMPAGRGDGAVRLVYRTRETGIASSATAVLVVVVVAGQDLMAPTCRDFS